MSNEKPSCLAIPEPVHKALVEQYNAEISSALLYRQFSQWFAKKDLKGSCKLPPHKVLTPLKKISF